MLLIENRRLPENEDFSERRIEFSHSSSIYMKVINFVIDFGILNTKSPLISNLGICR